MTTTTTTPAAVTKLYADLRDARGADGAASIQDKQVAILIRARLRTLFPGVKFSVRCSRGCSAIDVSWGDDGPPAALVTPILESYKFGGFDGSIDLAYSKQRWLLPDGSMALASCEGSQQCGGYVPSDATDCPEPGAILIKHGPRFVCGQQRASDEHHAKFARLAVQEWGWEYDETRKPWNQPTTPGGQDWRQIGRRADEIAIERWIAEHGDPRD
jgi:hypothetical protein